MPFPYHFPFYFYEGHTTVQQTTDDILESVKDRAAIPDGDPVLTDAKLLKWLDDETLSILVPSLIERREGHLVKSLDYTLDVGTNRYRIPERAYGEKLTTVQVIDSNNKVRTLTPSTKDEMNNYQPQSGSPQHFYIEGADVVVSPIPSTTGEVLRLNHYRRPNALVGTTEVGVVASVTSSTIVLVSGTMFTAGVVDYDVIRGFSPHDWVAIDEAATLAANTLTFSSFDPDAAGVERGDYVALAQETCVPNLPRDLVPILCQLGAIRYLEAMGDTELMQAAISKLGAMVSASSAMLGPRVDQTLNKVVSNLGRGGNRFPVGD